MLVALGAALLMLAGTESGMTTSDLSRVVQGVVTGIGFLGAGSILKAEVEREIRGLTTAAGIWLTAGVGSRGWTRPVGDGGCGGRRALDNPRSPEPHGTPPGSGEEVKGVALNGEEAGGTNRGGSRGREGGPFSFPGPVTLVT